MSSTVVGVFDDYSDAKRACERLETMGIDLQDIQIDSSASGNEPSLAPMHKEHEGGIRGFFAFLFSSDESEETSGHYSEAVRRGSAVVTVKLADDSKIDPVSDVLEDCGAIDIDVGKRQVERGGVRVHRRVSETPVEEQVTLREERAVVDRKPVDRPATGAELSDMGDGALSPTSPMATHLRDDATQGRSPMSTRAGMGGYAGPERRRQPVGGRSPAGIDRRAGM